MDKSYGFLSQVLDAITDHIVVIDSSGKIQYANRSWTVFGHDNGATIKDGWRGENYLDECDKASAMGDLFGLEAGTGIRGVIEKRQAVFYFEYPCHSPDQKRWFMMSVSPFCLEGHDYFVLSHKNITERKLAEEQVANLARIDGLTGIANRRAFDEFLDKEWRRCCRLQKPISLAILDLDYFKLLNDTAGHQAGDDCLIQVAGLLKEFTSRPSDICARYGGEEFVLAWGDTTLEQAKHMSLRLLNSIANLRIENCSSPIAKYLTGSIGVAEIVPSRGSVEGELISKADRMLYQAKKAGRNRVESEIC